MPADEVGTCGGGVASELVSLVLCIAGILAVIDADGTCVAAGAGAKALIERIGPMTALAEACYMFD